MAHNNSNPHQPTMPFSLPPLAEMTQGISQRDLHKTSPNDDVRDSGNWSMPSKHSSTVSNNQGLHLQTILNPEDSPNYRFSAGSGTTPSSGRYTSGATSAHSSHGPQGLPHLNQGYPSRDSTEGTFLDSRRSSVESNRVSMNMAQMHLNNPTSPYEHNNTSRSSLASSLQQQRGIQIPAIPRLNGRPRSPNGVLPAPRGAPKIAPPIIGPRGGGAPDPTASAPTKGYAWAFPDTLDEEMESPDSSRQGSVAASSVNTMELNPYGAHVHSLLPKSVTSLHGSMDASLGSGNYSRTPELRISHKLAERKRRSEMKDLFEQLNQILPNSPGSKSSKWEILTKAIDYIQSINGTMDRARREADALRDEATTSRAAIDETNRANEAEMTAMYRELCRLDPNGNHIYGPKSHAVADKERKQAHMPSMQANGPSSQQQQQVPPPPYRQMQGIEYNSYERR